MNYRAWCAGKRVLVTGGAGFLGRHLTAALVDGGARVAILDLDVALQRLMSGAQLPAEALPIACDLTDGTLKEIIEDFEPEVLFHLAGHASVPASFENPRRDFQQNALGIFELLETIRISGVSPAVINASSAAVYGLGGEGALREDQLPTPTSPYGASKLCAETYISTFSRAFGLRAASVRLFPLYGPGLHKHVVFDFLVKLTRSPESVEVIGDGYQVREFLYVSDAVDALITVAAWGQLNGEVYNAGEGTAVTIRELVNEVAKALSVPHKIVFTGQYREGANDRWIADGSRLRALGFRSRVSLSEGLRDTVEWFRAEVAPTLDE